MNKLCKIYNEKTKAVILAIDGFDNFYLSIGYSQQEVEQSDVDGCYYLKGFAPMKTDDDKAREADEQRIYDIDIELVDIDKKSIRDLRNFVVNLITKVSAIKITEPLKALKAFFDIIKELGGQSGYLTKFNDDAIALRKERQELWNKWHKGV